MKSRNLQTFETLKELKSKGFITLLSLSAEGLEGDLHADDKYKLIYTLYNPVNKEFKEIETTVKDECLSVCTLYKSANYDEREVYDLFGIKFKNHPNLKRIFLPENFKGHPLQKDYKPFNNKDFGGLDETVC